MHGVIKVEAVHREEASCVLIFGCKGCIPILSERMRYVYDYQLLGLHAILRESFTSPRIIQDDHLPKWHECLSDNHKERISTYKDRHLELFGSLREFSPQSG